MTPLASRSGPDRTGPGSELDDRRALWAAADTGWVMMAELLSATFVWGGIGWLADRWLDTAPWLMVAGFVVGWATGIYLLWMRSNGQLPTPGSAVVPSRAGQAPTPEVPADTSSTGGEAGGSGDDARGVRR